MPRRKPWKVLLWFTPFLVLIALQPVIIRIPKRTFQLVILLELILLTIVIVCVGIIYKYFKKKFREINELSGEIEVLDE